MEEQEARTARKRKRGDGENDDEAYNEEED
jgi:hypothetical protein